MNVPSRGEGVHAISVAAEMVGTNIQNLRVYERHGLVTPQRSPGGTRSYSANDIDRLIEVTDLLRDGLNIAGIVAVLELRKENARLQSELDRSRDQ